MYTCLTILQITSVPLPDPFVDNNDESVLEQHEVYGKYGACNSVYLSSALHQGFITIAKSKKEHKIQTASKNLHSPHKPRLEVVDHVSQRHFFDIRLSSSVKPAGSDTEEYYERNVEENRLHKSLKSFLVSWPFLLRRQIEHFRSTQSGCGTMMEAVRAWTSSK